MDAEATAEENALRQQREDKKQALVVGQLLPFGCFGSIEHVSPR